MYRRSGDIKEDIQVKVQPRHTALLSFIMLFSPYFLIFYVNTGTWEALTSNKKSIIKIGSRKKL